MSAEQFAPEDIGLDETEQKDKLMPSHRQFVESIIRNILRNTRGENEARTIHLAMNKPEFLGGE